MTVDISSTDLAEELITGMRWLRTGPRPGEARSCTAQAEAYLELGRRSLRTWLRRVGVVVMP